MSDNVIPIGGLTRLDLESDQVLEEAKGVFDGVVLMGWDKNTDKLYFASSITDGGDILWLLEQCKYVLLNQEE